MDTPRGIFGISSKSALRSEFNKSVKCENVRFDDTLNISIYEMLEEPEPAEKEFDREDDKKKVANRIVDSLITALPFGGRFNSPVPTDPRRIFAAREKLNAVFCASPPSSSSGSAVNVPPPRPAASYAEIANTPPVINFNSSRFGPIGAGRPTNFGTSNGFNSSFSTSSKFNNPLYKSSSNGFNSSSAFKSSTGSIRRPSDSYKTALCNQFSQNGQCTYGDECRYAHGIDELRTPPTAKPNYKTVLCRNFYEKNECPHGARCKFIHHRREKSAVQNDATPKFADSRASNFANSRPSNFAESRTFS